jgi:hypothetical protein
LKPERWGSPLVQEEKYRGEKDCDRRNNNNNNNNNNNEISLIRRATVGLSKNCVYLIV